MSDFLGKLAARSLGAADVVRAVVPSLFEPYRRNLGPQTKRRQGLATDPARQLETETIGDASPAQTATRVQPAAATFDPQTVKSSNAPPDLRGARQGSNGPLEVRGASSASPLNGLDPPAVQPTGHLTPAPAFFSRGHSSGSPTHLPGSPVPSIDSLETLSKPAQGVVSPGRSSVSPAHLSGSLAPSLDPREAPKLTPLPASPDSGRLSAQRSYSAKSFAAVARLEAEPTASPNPPGGAPAISRPGPGSDDHQAGPPSPTGAMRDAPQTPIEPPNLKPASGARDSGPAALPRVRTASTRWEDDPAGTSPRSAASASSALAPEARSEPDVRITIGKIDVRAVFPEAPVRRVQPPRSRPTLSLDDYLKRNIRGT